MQTLRACVVFLFAAFTYVSSYAEIVTFGAGNWTAQGVNSDIDSIETAVATQAGVEFTLTISAPGNKVSVNTHGELNTDGRNTWKDYEPLIFSIAVTDGSVETLSFNDIVINGLNKDGEQVTASESATLSTRVFDKAHKNGIVASDLYATGTPPALTALTANNTATWNLEITNTGNTNLSGIYSISFEFTLGGDVGIPAIASSVGNIHESGSAYVDVTFDKPVTGLETADFSVVNGTVASISGSDETYTVLIDSTASAGQTLSIFLPQGGVTPSNVISNTLDLSIVGGSPTPTLFASETSVPEDESIEVNVSFDMPIGDLVAGDFSVLRGSVDSVVGLNDQYTITVTPTGNVGDIMRITLPQDVTDPVNFESNVLEIGINASGTTGGGILMSSIFANDMVLQRDQVIPVKGQGFPGEGITVTFKNQTRVTTADDQGEFMVTLAAEPASADGSTLEITGSVSGPRSMRAYVGEVWMCSGQSNMADSFTNPPPAVEAEYVDWLQDGRFDNFYFSSRGSGWNTVREDNRNVVSRTAFYFGMEILKHLNPEPNNVTVPVGIIISANGGTPIQSWMPAADAEVIRRELGIQANWNDWENVTTQVAGYHVSQNMG